MKKNKTPHELIMKMKDPLEIFDLTCAANYFAGNFNLNMPVDNNREALNRIKQLLAASSDNVVPCKECRGGGESVYGGNVCTCSNCNGTGKVARREE